MDDPNSPGVGPRPLAWLTPGLFGLSWALLGLELVRIRFPVGADIQSMLFVGLAAGAHLAGGAAAWVCRHSRPVTVWTLLVAVVFLGFSAVGTLDYYHPATARALGLDELSLVPAIYYVWGVGLGANAGLVAWGLRTRPRTPATGDE